MYTKTRTLAFSFVTLLCVLAVSSPLTVSANQVVRNASMVKDASPPIYNSRSAADESSNSLTRRMSITGVDEKMNARSFSLEHGLRPVKRHTKGDVKKRKSCSSKKKSHAHKSKSSSDDSSSSSSTSTGTNYDSSSKSTKGKKKSSSSSSSDSSSSDESDNSDSSSSSHNSTTTSSSGSGPYTRVQQNRGSGFWSGNWDFWNQDDPTHGQVAFASESSAKNQGLIGTKNGVAFMRASNKDTDGGNRPSVRFQSKTAYDSGLIIFDVVKMPVGCATWPALWTTKGDSWPRNGEIDVVEGVGYTAGGKNANQMTVHLAQDSPLQLNRRNSKRAAAYTGDVMEGGTNCNQYGSGNTGCAFFDSNKNGPSWGKAFNSAGGGVWAMKFGNGDGVKIWFWGRKSGKIPDELSEANVSPKKLDPSSWGTPTASFQNNLIDSAIKAQNIIMDITIGGDWAGNVPMDGSCSGKNLQEVISKGSNYDDAEFIINGIDIYCKGGQC